MPYSILNDKLSNTGTAIYIDDRNINLSLQLFWHFYMFFIPTPSICEIISLQICTDLSSKLFHGKILVNLWMSHIPGRLVLVVWLGLWQKKSLHVYRCVINDHSLDSSSDSLIFTGYEATNKGFLMIQTAKLYADCERRYGSLLFVIRWVIIGNLADPRFSYDVNIFCSP